MATVDPASGGCLARETFVQEESDVTVIVVTSPSPSFPSTKLIDTCLLSVYEKIQYLKRSKTIIVLDGYKLHHENKLKQGKITREYKDQYDLYFAALKMKYSGPQFRIERLQRHMGFAFAVKHALDICTTTYALICQHDRVFCCNFNRLHHLLQIMEMHPHIRYIGFPTSTSVTHANAVSSRYHLKFLTTPPNKIDLDNGMQLQPLIYWYDSQHLCHVQRYQQIFLPYSNMTSQMRDIIGFERIKDTMVLRRGNFIEDNFGQAQRRVLVGLMEQGVEQHLIEEVFRWFGSYLCCITGEGEAYDDGRTQRMNTVVVVAHMKGRVTPTSFLQSKIGKLSFNDYSNCVGGGGANSICEISTGTINNSLSIYDGSQIDKDGASVPSAVVHTLPVDDN